MYIKRDEGQRMTNKVKTHKENWSLFKFIYYIIIIFDEQFYKRPYTKQNIKSEMFRVVLVIFWLQFTDLFVSAMKQAIDQQ